MNLFVAGLSYKTAPVAVRERMALPAGGLPCRGCRLKVNGDLRELVILSTCNRVELFGVAPADTNLPALFQHLGKEEELAPYLYTHKDLDVVRHLFRVAGGLDSMVLGETEITGQVKMAYQSAQGLGLTGRVLNRLFQSALQTAKEIRTVTQVGRGATSVGSVAVELAEKIFDGDLSGHSVLILGAGKMGEACARHLAKKGVPSVRVANRSPERAEALAREFGGQPVRFADRYQAMIEADIVVSSTGAPETVVNPEEMQAVMRARRGRPLFLVDIAVPRDIHAKVEALDNVFVYNIDHLEAVVRENTRLRERELARCQAIIEARAAALMVKLSPALAQLGATRMPVPAAWGTRRPSAVMAGFPLGMPSYAK